MTESNAGCRKRKLPEEFAQRTRPIPDYELHGSIHAAGSFLMGARANTLPPPSAFELSGQPEPIFERFSSSSEDTPVSPSPDEHLGTLSFTSVCVQMCTESGSGCIHISTLTMF